MTDKFTPPGEGWVEDNTPWEHAPQDNEVVVYTGPNGVRRWHRRVEPPLPTEDGWYLDQGGRIWHLLDGDWFRQGAGMPGADLARMVAPFTRLVHEDEHRKQVINEVRRALMARFDPKVYSATRRMINEQLDRLRPPA